MNDMESANQAQGTFRDNLKPALIFAGALLVLLSKEYVSAKLLMGLVLLDYFTTDFTKKLPMPICFIIFAAFAIIAAI